MQGGALNLTRAIARLETYNRGLLRSEKTVRFYNQRLGVLVRHLGDRPLETIDKDEIRSFLADLGGRCSPETVRGTAVVVRRLFSWAASEGMIKSDPLEHLRLPRPPVPDRPALTEGELRLLLDKGFSSRPTGRRFRAMFLLAVDTGLRVSELCALQAGDVDHDGIVRVRSGKGKKDRVTIAGQAALAAVAEVCASAGNLWTGSGQPISATAFRRALSRAGNRLAIKVHPHKLRRTFATLMLSNRADLFALQELMGHADISTTRRYVPRDVDRLRSVHRQAGPGDWLASRDNHL